MTLAGFSPGSVVKRYSSRCVPVASRTNTQRNGTNPAPALYQCPVPSRAPTRRVPPPYQQAHALGLRAVRPRALPVVFGGPVQVDEHRQRPRAGGEREPDQDREDDPAVPVAPGGERVSRADRVAVSGLAVDALALVP